MPKTTPEEKRRLIDSLEAARGVPSPSLPQSRTQAIDNLRGVVAGDTALEASLDTALHSTDDTTDRALRGAQAEARMLEETVQSFENKLLDSIAESGRLHQDIDETRRELFEARSAVAMLTRQRQELRERVEELRGQGQLHLRALAAAERELLFLNSRLELNDAD